MAGTESDVLCAAKFSRRSIPSMIFRYVSLVEIAAIVLPLYSM